MAFKNQGRLICAVDLYASIYGRLVKENSQFYIHLIDTEVFPDIAFCCPADLGVHALVGTHNKSLLVYQNVTLLWAAQLPHVPVAVKIVSFQ